MEELVEYKFCVTRRGGVNTGCTGINCEKACQKLSIKTTQAQAKTIYEMSHSDDMEHRELMCSILLRDYPELLEKNNMLWKDYKKTKD